MPFSAPSEILLGGSFSQQKEYIMLKESLIQPTKLQTKKSEIGGYGVFATEDIQEGELIEQAIYTPMEYRQTHVFAREIGQICYPLPCGCERCKIVGYQMCLSSGYINLYNHGEDEKQNVKFEWNKQERTIEVYCIREILKGEEVLHNYGPNYDSWNDVK